MNDAIIREALHRTNLRRHHRDPNTIVVDELGLKHGCVRADIAVVNGHLSGYEIKSDQDTLLRLPEQMAVYNEVFDRVTLVSGMKHVVQASTLIPTWWGIIEARKGPKGGVLLKSLRPARRNSSVNLSAVAQLLWRSEAIEILGELGLPSSSLRQRRSLLYESLTDRLSASELRRRVRDCLKRRTNWRDLSSLVPDGGSFQPFATL